MYTAGFGEVLTDILTVNPELASVSSASAILDTSNYTFQAVTFGKDADGFNHHAHTVYTSSSIPESEPYKHLVIFAGQSNMNGVGNDDGGRDLYYRETYGRPAKAKMWNIETKSFDDYVDPSKNTTNENTLFSLGEGIFPLAVSASYNQAGGNFGPELQFARNLEEDNIQNVYLMKYAMNGSFLVNLEGTEIHKMFGRDVPAVAIFPELNSLQQLLYNQWIDQDKASMSMLFTNCWNPSGGNWLGVSANPYTLYNRFASECRQVIDALGESSIKSVTFIWAQGEQETYQAQNTSYPYAAGYSAACSYLIDEVSSIFSGAENFYAIRSKVNSAFASGYVGNYQYYPSGFYSPLDTINPTDRVAWVNDAFNYDYFYNLGVLTEYQGGGFATYSRFPRIFAAASAIFTDGPNGASPGPLGQDFFGFTGSDKGRPYVPELQEQQEAMDTSKYGPLLDFDDLSGTMLNSGSSVGVSALSGNDQNPIFDGASTETWNPTIAQTVTLLNGVPVTINFPNPNQRPYANLNFHYNDAGLTEAGRRFYKAWVDLANPLKVSTGVSSYNDRVVVAHNYSNDDAPFASSYNISSTYLQLSTTYNSVPNYPNPKDQRLERGSTLTDNVSDYEIYSSLRDFGHYTNGGLGRSSDIWNVVGGFPPSGYQSWDYFILSSTDALSGGTDVRDLTYSTGLAASGELSGVFNADGVMDTSGFLTLSPLTGIGEQLSALGSPASGSAFSGGALVFSSTENQAGNGIANVAVRLKDGDAASIALFGGLNHIGVWCLDLKSMVADGLRPPFFWDNLDNIRKYKLVSKVSFWDNLLIHKDNSGQSGMEVLAADPNGDFKFGGPTFLLKFNFT